MSISRLLVAALAASLLLSAEAAKKSIPSRKAAPAKTVAKAKSSKPVETRYRRSPYVGAISADATGRVLFSANPDVTAFPASVTKLMTLLLVLEDVEKGKYKMSASVTATPDAYKSESSWVGIKAGETMSVRDLCLALMVESANDAAIVLGVNASGSLEGFVARMNARAKELGMTNTVYYNPNGLPPKPRYPWKSFNVTTATDQLKLALEILKHPKVFEFTSVKTCDLIKTASGYRIEVTRKVGAPDCKPVLAPGESIIKQLRNHNNVMVKNNLKIHNPDGTEAVDGLKTGYIDAGGSSIVATAQRKGKRVIVVVLGSVTTKDDRDPVTRKLLTDALGVVAP